MMRWPKNAGQMGQSRAEKWKRGVVIEDAVVELRDIFPTMLDAIGALDSTQ
jgi:arylsulfatase A-like enzyme